MGKFNLDMFSKKIEGLASVVNRKTERRTTGLRESLRGAGEMASEIPVKMMTSMIRAFEKYPHSAEKVSRFVYRVISFAAVRRVENYARYNLRVNAPEGVYLERNDAQRSFLGVIEDGIAEFRECNPEISVVWDKSEDYVGIGDFLELIHAPITLEEASKASLFVEDQELFGYNAEELQNRSLIRLMTKGLGNFRKASQDAIEIMRERVPGPLRSVVTEAYTDFSQVREANLMATQKTKFLPRMLLSPRWNSGSKKVQRLYRCLEF